VRLIRGAAAALTVIVALSACEARTPGDDAGATLAISCGAVGQEFEICRRGVDRWSAATGHRVELVSTPNSATERLALYQQLLAAGAHDVDVLQVDVIWPAILAPHLLDLGPVAGAAIDGHFPALVENNSVDGRLVALPWFTDAGVLYYRQDLLEKYDEAVPATWRELAATAARIQSAERAAGDTRMWGFVWQGRAYEGLTCNALEWVASHGGGTIVDADGRVTIDNPAAARALEGAAAWVGTISPPGVLNYAEEESRGVFQSGHAVFMRNWPYAWALVESDDSPVRGRVGVAPLPAGDAGRPAATLGGWQLAVSKYSRYPALAADLAAFLTSEAEQKRRALAGAFQPTIVALYSDPQVTDANPFFARLAASFDAAVARPSAATGVHYNRVSNAFYGAVHDVLSGRRDAADALADLDERLRVTLGEGS
jgi:trehalose/maltose transport system substrate-binding protein